MEEQAEFSEATAGSWNLPSRGLRRASLAPGAGLWPTVCLEGLPGWEVPLARQDAGAAAELDEELPLTQPVGLHHLAEGLVGWRERVLETITLFPGVPLGTPHAESRVPVPGTIGS